MGRPTRCSKELGQAVAEGILAGLSPVGAVARAGIPYRTHTDWMARAESGADAYLEYYQEVVAAQEQRCQRIIDNSDPRHHGWTTWLLERVHRRAYHLPRRVEASGPEGGPLRVEQDLSKMSTAELMAIVEAGDDGDDGD